MGWVFRVTGYSLMEPRMKEAREGETWNAAAIRRSDVRWYGRTVPHNPLG